jgi:hypothetical protein
MKNKAAVALGRLGGKVRSDAKTLACRQNGAKGGRPKKLDNETEKQIEKLIQAIFR